MLIRISAEAGWVECKFAALKTNGNANRGWFMQRGVELKQRVAASLRDGPPVLCTDMPAFSQQIFWYPGYVMFDQPFDRHADDGCGM